MNAQRLTDLRVDSVHPEPVASQDSTFDSAILSTLDTILARLDRIDQTVAPSVRTGGETILLLVGLFIGSIIIAAGIAWLVRRSANVESFPESFSGYLIRVIGKHPIESAAFFVLPLLSVIGIYWGSDRYFHYGMLFVYGYGVFGVMLTLLGAYYASKADSSSLRALSEARDTRNSVLHFAHDLESFVAKARFKITELKLHRPQLDLLTVLPAFGSVGLREYYRINQISPFHSFLLEELKKTDSCVSELRMITYGGVACYEWIRDALERAQGGNSGGDLEAEVDKCYVVQRAYLNSLLRSVAHDRRSVRIWDPQATDTTHIPFQLLLAKHTYRVHLFFLFSGTFLYQSLRRYTKETPMPALIRLTKGYYEEAPPNETGSSVSAFSCMFRQLFEEESIALTLDNFDEIFPDVSVVKQANKRAPNGATAKTPIV